MSMPVRLLARKPPKRLEPVFLGHSICCSSAQVHCTSLSLFVVSSRALQGPLILESPSQFRLGHKYTPVRLVENSNSLFKQSRKSVTKFSYKPSPKIQKSDKQNQKLHSKNQDDSDYHPGTIFSSCRSHSFAQRTFLCGLP